MMEEEEEEVFVCAYAFCILCRVDIQMETFETGEEKKACLAMKGETQCEWHRIRYACCRSHYYNNA